VRFAWISQGRTKLIAIVGICKNAGKTTVLNALLKQHALNWGVLSTGRDGESEDLVFRTPKPKVNIPPGSLFCCDTITLDQLGSQVAIRAKNTWENNRKLWIVQAEQELDTEITGPGNAAAQLDCAAKMLALGADKIIIDGSLDRKSIVLNAQIDAVLLVAGASFGTQTAILEELERLIALSGIKPYQGLAALHQHLGSPPEIMFKAHKRWHNSGLHSLLGHEKQVAELLALNPEAVYIPGAYSSLAHSRLGKKLGAVELIFRHPECLKLDKAELDSLLTQHLVSCEVPFRIKAIAVNAHGVGASDLASDELLQAVRSRFPQLSIFDTMELQCNER